MSKTTNIITVVNWDQIKNQHTAFMCSAQKAAMDYITLGEMLAELKERDYNSHGGDRTTSAEKKLRWAKDLQEHIGISYKTADRYIADYVRYTQIKQISQGEPIEVETTIAGRPDTRVIGERQGEQDKARQILAAVEANEVRPSRAWPGLLGSDNGGIGGKSAADRWRIIEKSLKSLKQSFREWETLSLEERESAKILWSDVRKHIPNELR
ncbi:MAG: hypothetical protein JJT75_15040 [Opitutales bacterium]|nr:hypothetical protein [Opitutales bacterium]